MQHFKDPDKQGIKKREEEAQTMPEKSKLSTEFGCLGRSNSNTNHMTEY